MTLVIPRGGILLRRGLGPWRRPFVPGFARRSQPCPTRRRSAGHDCDLNGLTTCGMRSACCLRGFGSHCGRTLAPTPTWDCAPSLRSPSRAADAPARLVCLLPDTGNLRLGPAVRGLLPEASHLFDDAPFRLVGARQITVTVLDNVRERLPATFQAGLDVPLQVVVAVS